MDLYKNLFKFPVVLADGDYEARKRETSYGDQEIELVIGEAEVPYFGFISVVTRWLPQKDSRERALEEGVFDACYVQFETGSYLVPWTKEKFKKEYKKFVENIPKEEPETPIKGSIKFMSKKDMQKIVNEMPDDE